MGAARNYRRAILALALVVVVACGGEGPLPAEAQEAPQVRSAEATPYSPAALAHIKVAAPTVDVRRFPADSLAGRGQTPQPPARRTTGSESSTTAGPHTATLSPRTLLINGVAIPYVDVRGGTTPSRGAGLWLGHDAVDDGSWGYFVGHNPGSFAPVRSLEHDDDVTLCDGAGNTRTYRVRSILVVGTASTWKSIAPLITGYGESVILQTCSGDGATNRVVVAC